MPKQEIQHPPLVSDFDYSDKMAFYPSSYPWFDVEKSNPAVLESKWQILNANPQQALMLSDEAVGLFASLLFLLGRTEVRTDIGGLKSISGLWEPDFILFKQPSKGSKDSNPYAVAASICFPTSHTAPQVIGKRIEEFLVAETCIDPTLANPVRDFLKSRRKDAVYDYRDWDLTVCNQDAQDPEESDPPLNQKDPLDNILVRFKHAGLINLSGPNGIIVMIRNFSQPILEVISNPTNRSAIQRKLTDIPTHIAEFKGLTAIMVPVLQVLELLDHSGVPTDETPKLESPDL